MKLSIDQTNILILNYIKSNTYNITIDNITDFLYNNKKIYILNKHVSLQIINNEIHIKHISMNDNDDSPHKTIITYNKKEIVQFKELIKQKILSF